MVEFDTGMTDRSFAQSKLMQYLEEEGMCVRITSSDDFVFEPWRFDGTKAGESSICLYGADFTDTPYRSLYDILMSAKNEADKKEAWRVLTVLLSMLCKSEKRFGEKLLPLSGPAGIFIAKDAFLFLPLIFCERCLPLNQYAQWLYPSLSKKSEQAYTFMFASFCYTVLASHPPFEAKGSDCDTLINDMRDKAFIPLGYEVYNCNENLAHLINESLSLPIKRTFTDFVPVVPKEYTDCIKATAQKKTDTFEVFNQKKEIYIEKRMKHVRRKRFMRKNSLVFQMSFVFIAIISLVAASIISDKAKQPTTLGMTAQEVVYTYYTSMSELDQIKMDMCVEKTDDTKRGSAAANYNSLVTSLYVTTKVRSAYEHTDANFTPAQWLLLKEPLGQTVFGVSQLHINEKSNATTQRAEFDVSFYLFSPYIVQSDDENQDIVSAYPLTITKNTDAVQVSFIKDRYLITGIENIDSNPIPVDIQSFFIENDVSSDSEQEVRLRLEYPWFPSDLEMERARQELQKRFSY